MPFEMPQGTPLVYVSFSAEISPVTAETLISIMTTCATKEVQRVYLMLTTPGGSVMNGLYLYHVLHGMPFELTIHNVGSVNSIGNAVFLAGAKRYAVESATFMFHGVGFNVQKDARFEEKMLRERLGGILSDQAQMGKIIARHTKLTSEEVSGLFREAQTRDTCYAVDKGIIDEVRDVQIPPGIPIITPVFQR